VTHILFTVTNPTVFLASFESQLWNTDFKSVNLDSTNDLGPKMVNGRFCSSSSSVRGGNAPAPDVSRSIGRSQLVGHGSNILSATASKLVRTTADVAAAMEAYPLPSTSSLGGEKTSRVYVVIVGRIILCQYCFQCCSSDRREEGREKRKGEEKRRGERWERKRRE
jgi:hypothetical protein